jgi:hypothetical protein
MRRYSFSDNYSGAGEAVAEARPSLAPLGRNNGMPRSTLAMLNIEPPEPKNSGANADDPINLAHLLGMLHIGDLTC